MRASVPKQPNESYASTVIQIIRLIWDKSARGGELASKRNAVPHAFSISPEFLKGISGSLLIEQQNWGDSNQFAEPFHTSHSKLSSLDTYKYRCLYVQPSLQGVGVIYDGDSTEAGAPIRPFSKTLAVEAGQWLRVRWNGRFSCVDSSVWWYEQVTVNIAHFSAQPDGNIFISSKLVTELNQLARLW